MNPTANSKIGPFDIDTIVIGDCLDVMRQMPDGCVDLVVTSPPYWNQRSYSFWPTYGDYMEDVSLWVGEVAQILKPGRHCFWVIPDKLPWPPKENGTRERLYMPIYADTERCASEAGLVCEFPIVWKKPHGTQKMFGSYPYPPTIIPTQMTERICMWRKPGKPDLSRKSDESRFTKEQWVTWAQDMWEINPETSIDHPAPFPEELVNRVVTLWSFVSDLVFDPFMGSGTTAVAAKKLGRHYFGCDINPEYVRLANERVANTAAPP